MTQQHPITPPPELLKQWEDDWHEEREHADVLLVNAYAAGALAGADAELEACCEFLYDNELCDPDFHKDLRNARRPKPLSLKEQALKALAEVDDGLPTLEWPQRFETIRRALEQLDD